MRIYYPSGEVKKVIKKDLDATIIRYVANEEYHGVANSIWKHSILKSQLIQKVYVDIDKESSSLCSEKAPSILRQTKGGDLIKFSEQMLKEEMESRAPTLYGCLCSSASSTKTKKKEQDGNGNRKSEVPVVVAASILLRQRCPQMSAIAYRFSIGVLWHSGAKKQVLHSLYLQYY